MQRLVTILLMLAVSAAASACTSDGEAAQPTASPTTSTSASSPKPLAGGNRQRVAKLMVGTDSIDGMLVKMCERGTCDQARGVQPSKDIKAVEGGLMLFVLGSRPESARVEVVLRGKSKAVASARLTVETNSLAWVADLDPGRYVIALDATWADREARWVFGYRVTRDS